MNRLVVILLTFLLFGINGNAQQPYHPKMEKVFLDEKDTTIICIVILGRVIGRVKDGSEVWLKYGYCMDSVWLWYPQSDPKK